MATTVLEQTRGTVQVDTCFSSSKYASLPLTGRLLTLSRVLQLVMKKRNT